jgi:hypothetical protein
MSCREIDVLRTGCLPQSRSSGICSPSTRLKLGDVVRAGHGGLLRCRQLAEEPLSLSPLPDGVSAGGGVGGGVCTFPVATTGSVDAGSVAGGLAASSASSSSTAWDFLLTPVMSIRGCARGGLLGVAPANLERSPACWSSPMYGVPGSPGPSSPSLSAALSEMRLDASFWAALRVEDGLVAVRDSARSGAWRRSPSPP